jgi:diadenosine tetraphosphate (Ap4A) HIT family hydrolase
LTYQELVDFLKTKMRMQHIYQPVLIRTLVDAGGISTVRQLARSLLAQDDVELAMYEKRLKTMPLPVLTKRGVLTCEKEVVRLTVGKLSLAQRATIRKLCEQRLQEFLEEYGEALFEGRFSSDGPVPGSTYYKVMKHANGRCALCGATREERSLHIDHIVPRVRWNKTLGKDVSDISNLQVLCSLCNTTKRDTDDTDFRELPAETVADCPFCGPAVRDRTVGEHGSVVAVLDTFPVTEGHTLVVPKRHVAGFFDLSSKERSDALDLMRVIRNRLAESDPRITGFNVGVNSGASAGQTVMHCHIHLIPRRDGDTENQRGGVRGVIPNRQRYG